MRRFAGLRRQGEFARVRARGRRTASSDLTVFRTDAAHGDQTALVGITVSKSVGGAVVRNRVRRRLSAALHDVLPAGTLLRLVVIARPSAATAAYRSLRTQLEKALA